MAPAVCPPHSTFRVPKTGEVAQNSLHTMGGSCCHVATSMQGMATAAPCSIPHPTWPETLPGMRQLLWAACSSASNPHREQFLLCISECFRESRPWGQWHCQGWWITQTTCWDTLCCHPEYFISSVQQASGSYSF